MLTGRRPDRSRVWTIGPYFRDTTGADWVTLPQAFKQAGFITGGAGKLFHTGAPSGFLTEKDNATGKEYVVRYGDDYPMSWTLPYNQNIDIMPADGQYPNDTHPKYPAKFPKPPVGGGYTSHGWEAAVGPFPPVFFCNFWLVCLQHWTLRLGAGFLASTHMASGNFLSYLITRG